MTCGPWLGRGRPAPRERYLHLLAPQRNSESKFEAPGSRSAAARREVDVETGVKA